MEFEHFKLLYCHLSDVPMRKQVAQNLRNIEIIPKKWTEIIVTFKKDKIGYCVESYNFFLKMMPDCEVHKFLQLL